LIGAVSSFALSQTTSLLQSAYSDYQVEPLQNFHQAIDDTFNYSVAEVRLRRTAVISNRCASRGYLVSGTNMRMAAFEHLRRLGEVRDHLTATELPGHSLEGRVGRVHLILHGHTPRLERARSMSQGVGIRSAFGLLRTSRPARRRATGSE